MILKNCVRFTNCISEISNTQIDNAEDIDIVMPVYNLIECSGIYSKTFWNLWQYCKGIPSVNDNDDVVEFNGANATDSFNFKAKIDGQTGNNETKEAEIMLPLKHLRHFWRTLEMPLLNFKINLILTWSAIYVVVYSDVANQLPHLK